MTPINSKTMLSCEECTYKTNDLPWKTAKKRMPVHKLKRHRKDHNDSPMETLTADLAEDAKQNPDMDKGDNPIQTSDLETPASKREESFMTGNDTGPEAD